MFFWWIRRHAFSNDNNNNNNKKTCSEDDDPDTKDNDWNGEDANDLVQKDTASPLLSLSPKTTIINVSPATPSTPIDDVFVPSSSPFSSSEVRESPDVLSYCKVGEHRNHDHEDSMRTMTVMVVDAKIQKVRDELERIRRRGKEAQDRRDEERKQLQWTLDNQRQMLIRTTQRAKHHVSYFEYCRIIRATFEDNFIGGANSDGVLPTELQSLTENDTRISSSTTTTTTTTTWATADSCDSSQQEHQKLSYSWYGLCEGFLLRVIHHATMTKSQLDIVQRHSNSLLMEVYAEALAQYRLEERQLEKQRITAQIIQQEQIMAHMQHLQRQSILDPNEQMIRRFFIDYGKQQQQQQLSLQHRPQKLQRRPIASRKPNQAPEWRSTNREVAEQVCPVSPPVLRNNRHSLTGPPAASSARESSCADVSPTRGILKNSTSMINAGRWGNGTPRSLVRPTTTTKGTSSSSASLLFPAHRQMSMGSCSSSGTATSCSEIDGDAADLFQDAYITTEEDQQEHLIPNSFGGGNGRSRTLGQRIGRSLSSAPSVCSVP